jgi:predicted DNA-binding transcriptional regulator AlpA
MEPSISSNKETFFKSSEVNGNMSPEDKLKEEFLSEEFVIQFTGFTKKTIQNLRSSGSNKIPPSKKIGAKHVYPVKDFREWLAKQPTKRAIA